MNESIITTPCINQSGENTSDAKLVKEYDAHDNAEHVDNDDEDDNIVVKMTLTTTTMFLMSFNDLTYCFRRHHRHHRRHHLHRHHRQHMS